MNESTFRNERRVNFTMLSNAMLRDPELSLKAKGLLALMLSFAESWVYRLEHLERLSTDGNAAHRTALIELEARGYLVRRQTRGADGRLGHSDYRVSDTFLSADEEEVVPDGVLTVMRFSADGESADGESADGKSNPKKNKGKKTNLKKTNSKNTPLPPRGSGAGEGGDSTEQTPPEFAEVKALIGQWCYGDPELRLATRTTHIHVAAVAKEWIRLHGTAAELRRRYAVVRRDTFWGAQATISTRKLGELFANPALDGAPTTPAAAPEGTQEAPQNPAQAQLAERAAQALSRLAQALDAGTAPEALGRGALRGDLSLAWHHPATHAALRARLPETLTSRLPAPRLTW